MAGLNAPAPAGSNEPEDTRGTLYGRILFIIYLILYCGFVLTTAFAPEQMERTPLGGINLSILYGLGLIGAAILMAVLYDWLCRASATNPSGEDRP